MPRPGYQNRNDGMNLIALFCARFAENGTRSQGSAPPLEFGVETWNELCEGQLACFHRSGETDEKFYGSFNNHRRYWAKCLAGNEPRGGKHVHIFPRYSSCTRLTFWNAVKQVFANDTRQMPVTAFEDHQPSDVRSDQRELSTRQLQRLIADATAFQGGGESDNHRLLKEFVARNPRLADLPLESVGDTEYGLPSGDRVDVAFCCAGELVLIEVKSEISSDADILRGLFQCVKYQAVASALQLLRNTSQNVRSILILGKSLPTSLMPMKITLGVNVIDGIKPG